jgi:hypothetical protein
MTIFDFVPNIWQEGLLKSANDVDIHSFKFLMVQMWILWRPEVKLLHFYMDDYDVF